MNGTFSDLQASFLRNIGSSAKALTALLGTSLTKLEFRRRLQQLYLTPVTAALALLCVILGIWWSYEVLAAPPKLKPPTITLPKRASASIAIKQFVPQPLDAFSVIDERPVFSPLRQPLKSMKRASAQMRQPPSFVLVGVILGGTERIAITKAPGASASVNVTPGQMIEGWEVVSVEPDHIELRADAQTIVLPLYSTPTQGSGSVGNSATVPPGQQLPFAPDAHQ